MTTKKRNIKPTTKKRQRSENQTKNPQQHDRTAKISKVKQQRVSNNAYRQLKYAIPVLMVAMVGGILLNKSDSSDPRVGKFLSLVCRTAECARFVSPKKRNLQAARSIRAGEILFEIPRSLQYWDLDALRDPFVRENLIGAKHSRTQNPLASGAYLAAWLAIQINQNSGADPARRSYLDVLPTYAELLSYHPMLSSDEELKEALGGHSLAFATVMSYRDMIISEYKSLAEVSGDVFAKLVTKEDYETARISVISRSFNPGATAPKDELDEQELGFYKSHGLEFTEGCQAMVPILDMLNHHPKANVGYSYDTKKRSFVIDAKVSIPSGWEIFDSYGKFTDSHLFAKFGFVNGDGSGWTQASLAIFHRLLDMGTEKEFSHLPMNDGSVDMIAKYQRKNLLRYLQYDDGYTDCIQGPESDPDEFELKILKLEYLVQIANERKHWIINVPPRAPKSRPVESSEIIITESVPKIDPRNMKINFSKLIETCRIISLVDSDYNGKARELLKNNLGNSTFVLQKDEENQSLEYRSVYCLARLSTTSLMQFSRSIEEEGKLVAKLNQEAYQSREWVSAHIRFGEMQILHFLSGIGFSIAKRMEGQLDKNAPENTIRENACPSEFLDFLMQPLRREVIM